MWPDNGDADELASWWFDPDHPEAPPIAMIGCLELQFGLEYIGWPLMEEVIRAYRTEKGLPVVPAEVGSEIVALGAGLNEADRQLIGVRYAAALEQELAPLAEPLHVRIDPRGPEINVHGHEVGMTGPGEVDFVALYGAAFTLATAVVVWAQFADTVKSVVKRLRERTGHPVRLNTGTAIFVAADAIFKETGERDLTLSFSAEMNPDAEVESLPEVAGYAVGFRDKSSVRIALMDEFGEHIVVRLLPLPFA
jgi:hypothetical protein